jgi:hypothetical protein
MRRLSLLLLALLLVPSALAGGSAGDGSLAVTGASARIMSVYGSGLIFGRINLGTLTIIEHKPAGGKAAAASKVQVSGEVIKLPSDSTTTQYFGSDMRFLLPSGRYSLRFEGVGIDISAVGWGTVSAIGNGAVSSGTLATNGGRPVPLSSGPTTLVFGPGKAPNAVPGSFKVDAALRSSR